MLRVNTVLFAADDESGEISSEWIVILIEPELDRIYLSELETIPKFPQQKKLSIILDQLKNGLISVTPFITPQEFLRDDKNVAPEKIEKREYRYKIIEPLIMNLPHVLNALHGEAHFDKRAIETGITSRAIRQYFNLYLQFGQHKNPLWLPTKPRQPKQRVIIVKQGRKRSDNLEKGKVIDDYDIKAFKQTLSRYMKGKISLGRAYQETKGKLYRLSSTTGINGEKIINLKPEQEIPTINQLRYWIENHSGISPQHIRRERTDATIYAKDLQGREGYSDIYVTGPGQVYQLDETPFDEEIVSEFDLNRTTPLAHPTVYFVRDVFSNAFTGLHVTVDNVSYKEISEALYVAFREKVKYCAENGITITKDEWPIEGVCAILLVDNAELVSRLSETPIRGLEVIARFTRAGRGDDKGLVENTFEIKNLFFNGFSPAHVRNSDTPKNRLKAKKNALLTIKELTRIFITFVISYNKTHWIDALPRNKQMIADGVKPIPLDMWKWGELNRPGWLRYVSEAELILGLLESGQVSIHREHLYLKGVGLRYQCDWTRKNGMQDRKENKNSASVMICRFTRTNLNFIFLDTADGLQLASLDARDMLYQNMTTKEISILKKKNSDERSAHMYEQTNAEVSMTSTLQDYINNALKEKGKISAKSLGSNNISENREREAKEQQIRTAIRFLESVSDHNSKIDESSFDIDNSAEANEFYD